MENNKSSTIRINLTARELLLIKKRLLDAQLCGEPGVSVADLFARLGREWMAKERGPQANGQVVSAE